MLLAARWRECGLYFKAQEWAGIASVGKRQKWADQLWMGWTFLFFFSFFSSFHRCSPHCVSCSWGYSINVMKIPSAIAFIQTINNWLWWYFHLQISLAVVYLTNLHHCILFFPSLSGLSSSSQLSCKWVKLCGHFELKCSGISSMDSHWTAGLSATICVQGTVHSTGAGDDGCGPHTTEGSFHVFQAP